MTKPKRRWLGPWRLGDGTWERPWIQGQQTGLRYRSGKTGWDVLTSGTLFIPDGVDFNWQSQCAHEDDAFMATLLAALSVPVSSDAGGCVLPMPFRAAEQRTLNTPLAFAAGTPLDQVLADVHALNGDEWPPKSDDDWQAQAWKAFSDMPQFWELPWPGEPSMDLRVTTHNMWGFQRRTRRSLARGRRL